MRLARENRGSSYRGISNGLMMKDSVIHVMEKIGIKKLREASVEKYEVVNDLIGF